MAPQFSGGLPDFRKVPQVTRNCQFKGHVGKFTTYDHTAQVAQGIKHSHNPATQQAAAIALDTYDNTAVANICSAISPRALDYS